MNFSLILTAGGTSSRYGDKNKLLEKINSKTVIEYALAPFLKFDEISQIIIPANISIIEELKDIFNNRNISIIEGGKTRQESVFKALQKVSGEYVLIHDGARPLVTEEIIKNVINLVQEKGAVTVMTKTTDTIKEVDEDGKIIKTIDRSKLYNTQTPQAFKTDLIKDAHNKLKDENHTDDSSMLEELGVPVYIAEGSYTNIKITSKNDLNFAKIYI
jgi:2-C-methyl-D-erythritol 4-phosphate cytidylyltransferase